MHKSIRDTLSSHLDSQIVINNGSILNLFLRKNYNMLKLMDFK